VIDIDKIHKKPSKYKAVKTVVDGITFDSKKEAKRYTQLILEERIGAIRLLELQPRFDVVVNGKKICYYKADFAYYRDGVRIIEDVKGKKTDVYILKKKLVEAIYGITITEI
jgi:hypothetical protein